MAGVCRLGEEEGERCAGREAGRSWQDLTGLDFVSRLRGDVAVVGHDWTQGQ